MSVQILIFLGRGTKVSVQILIFLGRGTKVSVQILIFLGRGTKVSVEIAEFLRRCRSTQLGLCGSEEVGGSLINTAAHTAQQ